MKKNDNEALLEALLQHQSIGVMLVDEHNSIEYQKNMPEMWDTRIGTSIENIQEFRSLYEKIQSRNKFENEPVIIRDCHYFFSGISINNKYAVFCTLQPQESFHESSSIQAILEGQENERRRIGREIHDGVGPTLSSIKLAVEEVKDNATNSELQTQLHTIAGNIMQVSEELRLISQQLVPRLLEEFGLYVAIESLIFKYNENKKLNISFYSNCLKQTRFNNEIELHLYRCAQELINNSIKYSKAQSIIVQLIEHSSSIVLMVEDNGAGFDKKLLQVENAGIGITNIDTRVRLLQGEFIIESMPQKGTIATIEIKKN